MVDSQGRRGARRSMSLSPKLNPLDAFLGEDDVSDGESGGQMGARVVPQQKASIIDESAIVRYYRDIGKAPIIFSEGLQGTARASDVADEAIPYDVNARAHYDVALRLDMTTGCGGKIWPAAEVLGQYIAARRSSGQWSGMTIVELGAGTGLVGLLAAQMPGIEKVYITDQLPMMHLMKENLALNQALRPFVAVEELNWGERLPATVPRHPNVLLLADCVYLEVAFAPLVETMCAMSTEETEILFCYQQRRKADKRFFKLLKRHFLFDDINDDDPKRREQYNRQGTHLYRVIRRPR